MATLRIYSLVIAYLGICSAKCPAPLTSTDTNSAPEEKQQAAIAGRVVGGNSVSLKELPYQLGLEIQDGERDIFCGAVLISSSYALTAAHCIDGKSPESRYVLTAGDRKWDYDDGHEQKRVASKLWRHPDYDKTRSVDDIAAIYVDNPFEINEYVKPVSLPKADFVPEGNAVVSGWGCTYADCNGRLSPVLQKVTVPIVPQDICAASYKKHQIRDKMLCAGYVESGGKDACSGDSGGPLVVRGSDGGKILAGIVSWGESCACPGYPGVYTRVSSYLEWIQDVMNGKERSNVLADTSSSADNLLQGRCYLSYGTNAIPLISVMCFKLIVFG